MLVDIAEINAAYNGGLILGYQYGPMGLEGEFSATLNEGETTFTGVNWDITTKAAYLVLRSPGNFYLKAKGGYINEEVNFTANSFSIGSKDSGASYGVGVGVLFARGGRIEIEYTLVEEDIDFISMGYLF